MNEAILLPICAVIPTMDRAAVLERTLRSLFAQSCLPSQIVVIDGSTDGHSRTLLAGLAWQHPRLRMEWLHADKRGAAAQRNQGVRAARQPFILFMDDDILFDDACLARLWRAFEADSCLGGASTMIKNQRYEKPGCVSRTIYAIFDGKPSRTYAGRVIGPAVNLLPEDNDDLPEVMPVEWLNTTCTLYRASALPTPTFDSVFSGYSLMEDVTLSLRVAKTWRIANARTARIFHDSQPGAHKSNVADLAEMSVLNRHYVMTSVLERRRIRDYAALLLWEAFQSAAALRGGADKSPVADVLRGKARAVARLVRSSRPGSGSAP